MLQTAYWLKWPKCKYSKKCGPDVSILGGPLSKAEWQGCTKTDRKEREGHNVTMFLDYDFMKILRQNESMLMAWLVCTLLYKLHQS